MFALNNYCNYVICVFIAGGIGDRVRCWTRYVSRIRCRGYVFRTLSLSYRHDFAEKGSSFYYSVVYFRCFVKVLLLITVDSFSLLLLLLLLQHQLHTWCSEYASDSEPMVHGWAVGMLHLRPSFTKHVSEELFQHVN